MLRIGIAPRRSASEVATISASPVEDAVADCSFDCQWIKHADPRAPDRKTAYPLVDRPVDTDPAWSESHCTNNFRGAFSKAAK